MWGPDADRRAKLLIYRAAEEVSLGRLFTEARRQADHPEGAPRRGDVVNLMEALGRSVGKEAAPRQGRKERAQGRKRQKEMLTPIEGKKAKEAPVKKPAARPQRKSA